MQAVAALERAADELRQDARHAEALDRRDDARTLGIAAAHVQRVANDVKEKAVAFLLDMDRDPAVWS